MDIPVSEDGIIKIASKIYGEETDDYRVFKDAAETRKRRKTVCQRFRQLSGMYDNIEDLYYYLSKEFNYSVDMIKKIVRKKHIYDREDN